MQFTQRVERIDAAVAGRSEQDVAVGTIFDAVWSGTQTGEVQSDQVGRGRNVVSDEAAARSVELCTRDEVQTAVVADAVQRVTDEFDTGDRSAVWRTTRTNGSGHAADIGNRTCDGQRVALWCRGDGWQGTSRVGCLNRLRDAESDRFGGVGWQQGDGDVAGGDVVVSDQCDTVSGGGTRTGQLNVGCGRQCQLSSLG